MQRSKKAEQREATIQKLLAIANEEFSAKGYGNASTEEIVQRAGVTRGALYHHFSGKRDLFLGVFKQAQLEIGEQIEKAVAKAPDSWSQLVEGCHAFLRATADPARQQIVVIDAPSVLAWNEYREVDSTLEGSGLNLLKEGLAEMIQAGIIKDISIEALAHLLSGAMDEAALWVAQSKRPKKALTEAMEALDSLLTGLKA